MYQRLGAGIAHIKRLSAKSQRMTFLRFQLGRKHLCFLPTSKRPTQKKGVTILTGREEESLQSSHPTFYWFPLPLASRWNVKLEFDKVAFFRVCLGGMGDPHSGESSTYKGRIREEFQIQRYDWIWKHWGNGGRDCSTKWACTIQLPTKFRT